MTDAQADILEALVDLGRATVFELAEYTGRTLTLCRRTVPGLVDLGYAHQTGAQRRGRTGQPPKVWAATVNGVFVTRAI